MVVYLYNQFGYLEKQAIYSVDLPSKFRWFDMIKLKLHYEQWFEE